MGVLELRNHFGLQLAEVLMNSKKDILEVPKD